MLGFMKRSIAAPRPLFVERIAVALLAAIALGLAGCGRTVPAAAPITKDAIPGLIDVELRGVSPEHAALAATLGKVLEDETVDEGLLERDELVELEVDPAREEALLEQLRARPDVIFAEPVTRVEALWLPNDPDFSRQWHLKAAGAPAAWESARGEGVTVAVIDTGIYPVDDLDEARIVPGYNFIARSADARDDHGHGTHVAGTIAQSTGNGKGVAGMAPLARLMPIKVLSAFGGGTSVAIADGIRWAVDHGARVLNLSLGGGGRSLDMESAVAYARRKGAVVICAAGNSGSRGVSFPAAYPGAFAVSAVGPAALPAPYTSYGPEVAIAAPGGDKTRGEEGGVLQQTLAEGSTTRSAYRWFQGTSMATPHVAGAAALIESLGVSDPGAVERVLTASAAAPALSDAERFGAGLLDAAAAVRRVTLWWGLWRLGFAVLGAWLALGHARRLQQLSARDRLGAPFWAGLALGSGALTMLAPLGLARLHFAAALALPPMSMASHWLGLPGTTTAATAAAFIGASALLPLLLALAARAAGSPAKSAFAALVAGVAFGWAGMLLHAALFRTIALPWLPSLLTPAFVAAGAVLCWAAGRGLFAKESLR
jgi:serine protease